jgi:putative ABC transport system permease protein
MSKSRSPLSSAVEVFWQDLRYGIRVLTGNPVFSSIAIFTLALGIGANTAVFSIVNAVLLRSLPFKDAARLVLVWQTNKQKGIDQAPTSYPNYRDWRENNGSFEGVGAWSSYTDSKFTLTGRDTPEQIQYALVSANFFSVLGVEPKIGRAFNSQEDEEGGPPVAMLTYNLWQRDFGGNENVIGKPIKLDDKDYTVVGILPPEFKWVSYPKDAEVWLPIGLDPLRGRRFARTILYLGVIGRLKPGVTIEQAAADMNNTAQNLSHEYPEDENWSVSAIPLHKQVVGEVRQALMVLLAAVGFVLLIACANVANLLLARSVGRQQEISIRTALGASRERLVRQLLTESVLLSVLGGILGAFLAQWLTGFFSLLPYSSSSYFIPYNVSSKQMGFDVQVLGFTVLLTLVTGLIFGLAPALRTSKLNQYESLKGSSGRTGGSHHHRVRGLLVVSEVALSLMLLIGAGLMMKSFLKLQEVDPGFNPSRVLTMEVYLPKARYSNSQVLNFYKQALQPLETLPGVRAVGVADGLPLNKFSESTSFVIEGRPVPPLSQMPLAYPRIINNGYFSATAIRVQNGRDFAETDNADGPRVAVINEAMARLSWPNENAVGKRLALTTEMLFNEGQLDFGSAWREIVGVVANVRESGLDEEPKPQVYVPFAQRPVRDIALIIRTASSPESLTGTVRARIEAVDPELAITNVKTMTELVNDSVMRPRSNFLLLLAFAVIALVLALAGVYGVMSYSVAQRMHEFGIRVALGARHSDLIKQILREGLTLALVGVTIGLAGAWGLTRFLASLLFGVSTTDPATFAIIALTLIVVALLACYIPARKATRADPIVVLRSE